MNDTVFLRDSKSWTRFILYSIFVGFLAIPLHEFGHTLFYWVSGEPASMSYAKEYTLSGNQNSMGLLGGPLMTILLAYVAIFIIYFKRPSLFLFVAATILSFDRLFLYLIGLPNILSKRTTGMDETKLSSEFDLPYHFFFIVFFLLEILALFLILRRPELRRLMKVVFPALCLIFLIVMALFGIFVVEKNLFPSQFASQFGK